MACGADRRKIFDFDHLKSIFQGIFWFEFSAPYFSAIFCTEFRAPPPPPLNTLLGPIDFQWFHQPLVVPSVFSYVINYCINTMFIVLNCILGRLNRQYFLASLERQRANGSSRLQLERQTPRYQSLERRGARCHDQVRQGAGSRAIFGLYFCMPIQKILNQCRTVSISEIQNYSQFVCLSKIKKLNQLEMALSKIPTAAVVTNFLDFWS